LSDTTYSALALSAAASIIDTNGGNDTVNASGTGLVNKTIDLGAGGNDRIVNTSTSFALTIDSIGAGRDIQGVDEIVGAGTGTQAGRTIAGTSNGDYLDFTGIALTNVRIIQGLAGNDTIIGSAGNDWIEGGIGADSINGGNGDDTISGGGAGVQDTTTLGSQTIAQNRIEGGAGNDVFLAGSGRDTWSDSSGTDELRATFEDLLNDTVLSGIEKIVNTNASFWLTLDSFGKDRDIQGVTEIVGTGISGAGTQIQGTCNGNDWLDFCGVTLTNITSVDLKSGDDYVRTAASHSVMTVYDGNAGTDTIRIGLTMDQALKLSAAGELEELLDYLGAPAGKTLALESINVTARNFEAVELGACGWNVIRCSGLTPNANGEFVINPTIGMTPTTGNDLIISTCGPTLIDMTAFGYKLDQSADIILLGDGDDTLFGYSTNFTNSVIAAGDGWDKIMNNTVNTALVFKSIGIGGNITGIDEIVGGTTVTSVQTGTDMGRVISGTAGNDFLNFTGVKLTDIRLIDGIGGNDTIIGSAGGDSIMGGDGADSIDGGAGNDTLAGSQSVSLDTSANRLEGGAGDDVFLANGGADTFSDSSGTDEIRASGTALLNDLVLGGIEKLVNTSASFALSLDSFGAGRDIQGVTEIVGLGTGTQAGRNIQGTANADLLDFTGVTLTNIAKVQAQNGNDVITVASAHSVLTAYEGGLPSSGLPGDTIRINDALYDKGGTAAGVTTAWLAGTTTAAFTYSGFETVDWFL